MPDKHKKASEMISESCCGSLLPGVNGKSELIAMVEKLERDNEICLEALTEIQTLPSSRDDESSGIAFRARKTCE